MQATCPEPGSRVCRASTRSGGGLPRGRPTLLCGGAGCGKTLVSLHFLVRGAVEYGEPGVFVAVGQSPTCCAVVFDLREREQVERARAERAAAEEANARAQAPLSSELLDVSRIVAGKLHLEFEVVDVRAIVRGLCLASCEGMYLSRILLGLPRAASRRPAWRSALLPSIASTLALGIALAVWRRRVAAERPLPRLPVRRRPAAGASSRPRRLEQPAPELAPPPSFWDAAREPHDDSDDPAEIPRAGLPLVSEASQSAALDPADREQCGRELRW